MLRSGTGSSGVLTASSSSDKVGEWRTAGELHSFVEHLETGLKISAQRDDSGDWSSCNDMSLISSKMGITSLSPSCLPVSGVSCTVKASVLLLVTMGDLPAFCQIQS